MALAEAGVECVVRRMGGADRGIAKDVEVVV